MAPLKVLSSRPSLASIRKQAKKLVRQFAAGDPEVLARVHVQLPVPALPFSLRDAQLVLAREYGFAGWRDLRAAALRREGMGLEWAAAEAERAIHESSVDQLASLLREHPALLTWRDDFGKSLLTLSTESFGDSGDPFREQQFTRIECAEFLLDAGAQVEPAIWAGAIHARAKGVLQLGANRGLLPRSLEMLTALGDFGGVRDCLPRADAAAVTQALLTACGFRHYDIAALLLDRCLEMDPVLGQRVAEWGAKGAFLAYLAQHPPSSENLWTTFVMSHLRAALRANDLEAFRTWLPREPELRAEANLKLLINLVEIAAYSDREPFITPLLEFAPLLKRKRPPSSAVVFALEYGNAHLVPLLQSIWPLPDDLPHAAGIGNLPRVRRWFDEAGRPKLGSLSLHYPTNNAAVLKNLHWMPANVQHVLDVAFAWACVNRHLDTASFLLERGANINTDWSTHEPASILHECAIRGNYTAAQFLINRGIDMTIRDYRWNGTAEGWALHASVVGQPPLGDKNMAEFLARAERRKNSQPSEDYG